jgi:hydroxymethylbilane synthase
VIGTSSVRRVAQLRSRYPKLVFSDVRGNLNTRLAKLDAPTGPYTALILAAAGLHRLSFEGRVTAYLQPPTLYYSVGQGALTIEVRSPPPGSTAADNRDCRIRDIIRSIGCWQSTWRCEAERALLRKLEGGCSIPVGVDTWIGEQAEEERRGPKTRVSRKKSNADELEDVEVEGHFINPSKADEAPSRPDLRRLETDQLNGDADKSASNAMPEVPRLPSAEIMSIENIATPPSEGARLHLSSNVVSLDGTRRTNAYLSAVCHSVEDAIALGERVADILIQDKDARSILDEVERHRTLAERADERRRAERKERLKRMDPSADAGQELDTEAVAAGLARSQIHAQNGVKDVDEEQHKLMQVIGLSDLQDYKLNGNGGLGYGEGAPTGEVDRRGVARDDGQPKAWEV